MNYISDLKMVYSQTFKETIETIKKSPMILFLPLIYSIIYGLLHVIYFSFGLATSRIAGVLLGLVQAMILSSFFTQMESGINYNRINLNSFFDGFFVYLWNIYFMRFIFYVVSIFLWRITTMTPVIILSFVIFNVVGEAIYLRNVESFQVFTYPAQYLFENWHLWIIPIVLIYLILTNVLGVLSINPLEMYLHPIVNFNPTKIVVLIILGFYFTFRGVLFKITRVSSMRKRKYMESFK